MSDMIRISVHRGRDGLADLKSDWEALEASLTEKRFFHRYSWYCSYLDNLETDPQAVYFFAFYQAEKPIAIFPLKQSGQHIAGIPMRILEVPRHTNIDLGDFIFERTPANGRLVSELVAYLHQHPEFKWDWLSMTSTLEDSSAAYALRRDPPMRLGITRHGHSNFIDCHGGDGAVFDRLSTSFRKNLRRWARNCEKQGVLSYRSVRQPDELARAFEQFLDVEADSWKGTTGTKTAIRLDPAAVGFFRDLMTQYARTGDCVINLLMLNDVCIAAQFCLRTNGVLYVIKIGYRQEFQKVAPGNLLFERLLGDCRQDGYFHSMSFVTGSNWQDLWNPSALPVANYHLFNRTLRGIAAYLFFSARNALRTRQKTDQSVSPAPEEQDDTQPAPSMKTVQKQS